MKSVTVSAKSLDEAITQACTELGVGMDEVDFEVLEDGGMFHKMQVKVSVKAADVQPAVITAAELPPVDAPAAVEEFEIVGQGKPGRAPQQPRPVTEFDANCPKFTQTLAFAEKLFALLDDSLTITTSHDDHEFVIHVDGADVGRLIGKEGRTLAAINALISTIAVNTHSGEPRRVSVDVGNYRSKRHDKLVELAKRKAEYVKTTGKSVKLEPMPARERVIVHTTLQDVEGIITQSEGVEPHRYLVIKPGAR